MLKCLRPICAALDYAHHKRIVHRDLKPGNVLVNKAGVVKVSDFGLARAIHASMSKFSREPVSGTLLYMSPEQCRGKPTDASSDIYSLGMMTYELLTGQAPFVEAGDITRCQIYEDIEPIPGVPDHVNAALAAATAKEKQDRPESAGDFLRILRPEHPPKSPFKGGLKAGQTRTFDGIEMVWCPPGSFLMGSKFSAEEVESRYGAKVEWCKREHPQHTVTLTQGFWMGKRPVTVGHFRSFVEATGYTTEAEKEGWSDAFYSSGEWGKQEGCNWQKPGFTQEADHPVVCVSWNDAHAYVAWINTKGQGGFRLPTEAEWEYACRAGSATAYCFGDDESGLSEYAWYGGSLLEGETHPVGGKKPNAWGLYDMHGNVWEWCQDWLGDYPGGSVTDPAGPASGSNRVLRGGGWFNSPRYCRSANRFRRSPAFRDGNLGFRLAAPAVQ